MEAKLEALLDNCNDIISNKGLATYLIKNGVTIETPIETAHWVWNPDSLDFNVGAWECSSCGCRNHNIPNNPDAKPHMYGGARFCPQCGKPMGNYRKGSV